MAMTVRRPPIRRPLDGMLVLDLGQIYNGPYAGLNLGVMGARVLKSEPPEGDVVRRRKREVEPWPLVMLNSNKESVVLDLKQPRGKALFLELVSGIVEKPKPDEAPSTLAVVGRYVLTPKIFDYLENLGHGAGGEIQLTDGIAALMAAERVLAYRYVGQRYDCGSKLGYLKATTAMGLKHPETGAAFAEYLAQTHLQREAAPT